MLHIFWRFVTKKTICISTVVYLRCLLRISTLSPTIMMFSWFSPPLKENNGSVFSSGSDPLFSTYVAPRLFLCVMMCPMVVNAESSVELWNSREVSMLLLALQLRTLPIKFIKLFKNFFKNFSILWLEYSVKLWSNARVKRCLSRHVSVVISRQSFSTCLPEFFRFMAWIFSGIATCTIFL